VRVTPFELWSALAGLCLLAFAYSPALSLAQRLLVGLFSSAQDKAIDTLIKPVRVIHARRDDLLLEAAGEKRRLEVAEAEKRQAALKRMARPDQGNPWLPDQQVSRFTQRTSRKEVAH
jgi:hypothetical protein